MTRKSKISSRLAYKAVRLHKFRKSVDGVTRIGIPCMAVLFVGLLLHGLGLLPTPAIIGAAAVAFAAVAATFAGAYAARTTPEQALITLGRTHGLADAALTALELDRRLTEEKSPVAAAFIRAHIQQTYRKLEAVPATKFFPSQLIDRLQVIAILCLCVVTTALL